MECLSQMQKPWVDPWCCVVSQAPLGAIPRAELGTAPTCHGEYRSPSYLTPKETSVITVTLSPNYVPEENVHLTSMVSFLDISFLDIKWISWKLWPRAFTSTHVAKSGYGTSANEQGHLFQHVLLSPPIWSPWNCKAHFVPIMTSLLCPARWVHCRSSQESTRLFAQMFH